MPGRTECNDWIDRDDRYPLYGEQYATGATNVLTYLGVHAPGLYAHNFAKGDFSGPVNGSIGSLYNYTTKHEFQDSGLARDGWVHKGVLFTPTYGTAAGATLALGVTADSWGVGGNSSFAAVQNPTPPEVPRWEATYSGGGTNLDPIGPWVLWVSFGNYHYSPYAGSIPQAGRASPMHATGTWTLNYPIDVFVAFTANAYIKYSGDKPYIEIKITEGAESVTRKAVYHGTYDSDTGSSGQTSEIFKFRYTVTQDDVNKVPNGWVTVTSDAIELPTDSFICGAFGFVSVICGNPQYAQYDYNADVTLPVKITSVAQSNVTNGFRYTVTYEQPVKVIGAPYLTATGTSKDEQTTKIVKAKYLSGSESNTLIFEYLLQDDDGLGPEPTFSWGWLPPIRRYAGMADQFLMNQAPEFMMRFDKWIEEVDDGSGGTEKVERNSYILAKRSGQTAYDWDADRRMPANVPSETWTVKRTTAVPGGNQTQAELEEPVEVVLRSLIAPTRIVADTAVGAEGATRGPVDLRFPTRSLNDCEQSGNPNCGVVIFTYGVLPALDEAVSQNVQDNAVGAYIVTKPGPLDEWERRFPPLARHPADRLRRGRATLLPSAHQPDLRPRSLDHLLLRGARNEQRAPGPASLRPAAHGLPAPQ